MQKNIFEPDSPKPFRLLHIDELPSTNRHLKENSDNYPDYTVIWADKQTAGKGRLERSWISADKKDLTFSILLPLKNIPAQLWPNITQITALAILKSINNNFKLNCKIKWPNDILINNKKICGILSETTSDQKFAIIGIGLNVNSSKQSLKIAGQPATSISAELGKYLRRKTLLYKILNSIYSHFSTLKKDGFSIFIGEINKLLLYKKKVVTVSEFKKSYRAIIIKIDDDGHLIVRDTNGTYNTIISADIIYKK